MEATADIRVSAELLTGRKTAPGHRGYLEAHARLYAPVTDRVRVAAALLASRMARGRLASPFTAREVYRNDWTGLTDPRVVGEALECLRELGWIPPEAAVARDGYGFFCVASIPRLTRDGRTNITSASARANSAHHSASG